jgi:predicted dehydrogenase
MGAGMNDTRVLRIGMIGCGKIADGHAEVLRFLPGAELVAVCDREPLLAEQLAVRFGVPAWFSDTEAMLESSQLDVVHITTPPGAHLALTEQCVASGANVFLEKPLAPTAADCRTLIETVERAGRRISINYWPNFDPPALQLKQMLADGVIGNPVHVEALIGYDLAGAYGQALMADGRHWVHALPGKLFHNMMDHIFNRIVPLLPHAGPGGIDLQIDAHGYKRRPQVRGDSTDAMLDELRVYLQAGGVSAYGSLCSHARPVANLLRVYGTKNTVELDFQNRTVILAASQRYPSALGRLVPAFQSASRYFAAGRRNVSSFRRHQFQYFAGMSTLLERFYASIRDDGPLPIAYAEMVQVAEVMDRVIAQVYPRSVSLEDQDGGVR